MECRLKIDYPRLIVYKNDQLCLENQKNCNVKYMFKIRLVYQLNITGAKLNETDIAKRHFDKSWFTLRGSPVIRKEIGQHF